MKTPIEILTEYNCILPADLVETYPNSGDITNVDRMVKAMEAYAGQFKDKWINTNSALPSQDGYIWAHCKLSVQMKKYGLMTLYRIRSSQFILTGNPFRHPQQFNPIRYYGTAKRTKPISL